MALATRKIHAYVATGRAKHPAETTRKIGGEMTQKIRQQLAPDLLQIDGLCPCR